MLSEQAEGFVTLQKAPNAQNPARDDTFQLAQNTKKVSLEGFNPLTIEKDAEGEPIEGKVQNHVHQSSKVPVKNFPTSQSPEEESNRSEPQIKEDPPTGQSSSIETKTPQHSENVPEQNATAKVQKVHLNSQHFTSNPDILNAMVSKQGELVQDGNESTLTLSTDQTVVCHVAEGDIHDIGKAIVTALLKANGYEVIDLGKDVPVDEVVEAVKKYKPAMLTGTALMTTTMTAFEKVAEKLRAEGINVPFVCGGGAVSEEYVTGIELGIYGKDAALAPAMAADAVAGMDWKAMRAKYNG